MVARATPDNASKRGARTGIAISATEVCAADVRLRGLANGTWQAPLEPPTADGAWPSLANALADLARAIGVAGGPLSISLMPPLTEVRQLELPPIAESDLQRVLSRDAARYFVNARTPQIVGASTPRRSRRSPGAVVAAAASARLVSSIRAAASHAGWTVTEIGPAESAWAGAAVAMWPALAKQSAYALIAHDDRTDLLQLEAGRLAGLRRFRAGSADAAMIADAVGPSARVGIAGSLTARQELSSALTASRVAVVVPPAEWLSASGRGDTLAALFAGDDAGPLLRTDAVVAQARAQTRRAAWLIGGVAAGLLVAAAIIELVGLRHQLDRVRAERAALRPQLSATLVGRTTVAATYSQLSALDSVERVAPQWSVVISTLSESVPPGAHLTAIRARDDSLIIDGLAARAKPVFDALEGTPGLVDVRAASPVRRELQDNGAALEHFTIAARVVAPRRGGVHR